MSLNGGGGRAFGPHYTTAFCFSLDVLQERSQEDHRKLDTMAKIVAKDLDDLGNSVGEVVCTFLDILLHAMVPLVNDPYFGDLFIGFRLLIALFVWGALIISSKFSLVQLSY